MAFFRLRRSIRIFQKKSVERKKLKSIIEAGRFAPTGGNRQPLRYIVLQTAERIEMIRSMTIDALANLAKKVESAGRKAKVDGKPLAEKYRRFQGYVSRWREMAETQKLGKDRIFFHAPVIMICHFDPFESVTPEADPGLAAMQMTLMAEALGLGTCFCGFLVFAIRESPELREVLQIPKDHSVPFSFMVGYPDVKFSRLVSRKPARVLWF
jgi:nitroreductase